MHFFKEKGPIIMSSIANLSPAQRADLYAQVGDAMNNPGFNYDAHVSANTKNGVFTPPTNNPPATAPIAPTTPATIPAPPKTPTTIPASPTINGTSSTITNLSPSELKTLYSQVGDAVYAPGFDYSAHVKANTVNGVFTPPVYIPTNTTTLVPIPAAGSEAYQKLLTQTGGAAANPNFNYAAHIAATVSQSRKDLSYDNVIRIMTESKITDFSNFDLTNYRNTSGSKVGLGKEFANDTVAAVAVNQIQQSAVLKMPEVGSTKFKALSAETGGASESPGFNYLAHVAAITSQKVLTSLSYAEVMTLIAETGKTDFKDFDLAAHKKEKINAEVLITRFIPDPAKTNNTIPVAGSNEYQTILKETGLKDLAGFDYSAYLGAKREAQLALSTLQGSTEDDVVVADPSDKKTIFVSGKGNDKVTASLAADILIGGEGNDVLDGGAGVDKAVFNGKKSEYSISRSTEQLAVTDAQSTRDGIDTLKNIERLSFSDSALALDTGLTQSAGQTALLLGAVLPGQLVFDSSKQALLGSVMSLFDEGFTLKQLSGAVLRLPIWDVLTGKAAPTNTDIANYLLTNVNNGLAPSASALTTAVTALNTEAVQGEWLASIAAASANQTHINLVGLQTTGLTYL